MADDHPTPHDDPAVPEPGMHEHGDPQEPDTDRTGTHDPVGPDEPDTEEGPEPEGDDEDFPPSRRLAAGASDARVANPDNARRLGQLTVWYDSRTVVLPIDGDSALRLITAWQRDQLWRGDTLRPEISSAANVWAAVQLGSAPLAMLWTPAEALGRLPTKRIAIDPAVA